jgi:hypothetical protein
MSEPAIEPTVHRAPKAPRFLQITVKDSEGSDQRSTEWSTMIAQPKDFFSGSASFYGSDKTINPQSADHYQCGLSFTLIGSKPGK